MYTGRLVPGNPRRLMEEDITGEGGKGNHHLLWGRFLSRLDRAEHTTQHTQQPLHHPSLLLHLSSRNLKQKTGLPKYSMHSLLIVCCEATIDFLKKERKNVDLEHFLHWKPQKGHMTKLQGGLQKPKRAREWDEGRSNVLFYLNVCKSTIYHYRLQGKHLIGF